MVSILFFVCQTGGALHKGIWGPKPRVTNIKGTKLKSLIIQAPYLCRLFRCLRGKMPKITWSYSRLCK